MRLWRSFYRLQEPGAVVDFPDDVGPAEKTVSDVLLVLDGGLGEEKKLREISEKLSIAQKNAVGGDELEQLADDLMDVRGSYS